MTNERMELEGKVAAVVGGGGNIGAAIAVALAEGGCRVALIDVSEDRLDAALASLPRQQDHIAIRADVSEPAEATRAVTAAADSLGGLYMLVNASGVAIPSPFLEITPENWRAHMGSHLDACFFTSQAAARKMAEEGSGRIVNFASVAGLMGPIDLAPYSAAKAGIIGLTRAAAVDLADAGITVNAIAPGPIDTEMVRQAWEPEALAERAKHQPIQRFGRVEEIAAMVRFLAGSEAGYISGVTIPIDGGASAAGSYMVEVNRRRSAAEAEPSAE